MEELHKISRTYYENANRKIRRLAKDFFKAMDQNRDKKVHLHEFLAFMNKEGYSRMNKAEFFNMLVKDGASFLEKWEVRTLYYIINSGRPFCDGCGEFVVGMYFTCTKCFECSDATFNVCFGCFSGKKYSHIHKEFLDNFALLEGNRMVALKQREPANPNEANMSQTTASPSSTSTAIVPAQSSLTSAWLALTSSTSTAIVPANNSQTSASHVTSTSIVLMNPQNRSDRRNPIASRVTETALSAGTIASNLCNIM